jgi:pilus assembly protein Flp/PilA
VKNLVKKLRRGDEGASAVEYGLLVALIAVVIAAGVALLGSTLNTKIQDACAAVANAGTGTAGCTSTTK